MVKGDKERKVLQWAEPCLIDLSNRRKSHGLCGTGTGDGGDCITNGNSAGGWCTATGSNAMDCGNGTGGGF